MSSFPESFEIIPKVLHECIFGYLQKSEYLLIAIHFQIPDKNRVGIHRKDNIYRLAYWDENTFVISEAKKLGIPLEKKFEQDISILASKLGDLNLLKSINYLHPDVRNFEGSIEVSKYLESIFTITCNKTQHFLNIVKHSDIELLRHVYHSTYKGLGVNVSSPIYQACITHNNLPMLQLILSNQHGFFNDGDIPVRFKFDMDMVAEFAIFQNQFDIFKWLVKEFDIKLKSKKIAMDIIEIVAQTGNMEFFLLVCKIKKITCFTSQIFNNAAQGGNVKILEYLLEKKCDTDGIAVEYAMNNKDPKTFSETINWLIKHGFELHGNCYVPALISKNQIALDFLKEKEIFPSILFEDELMKEEFSRETLFSMKWFLENKYITKENFSKGFEEMVYIGSEEDENIMKWLLDNNYITDEQFDKYYNIEYSITLNVIR